MRIGKILGIWAVIAGLLFWNGALGLGILNPLLGREAGEMMTFFIALVIIGGVSRTFLREEREQPRTEVARISVLWMALTLALEVGLGRLAQLFSSSIVPGVVMWDRSFWPLIVLVVGMAPFSWLRRSGLPLSRVTK